MVLNAALRSSCNFLSTYLSLKEMWETTQPPLRKDSCIFPLFTGHANFTSVRVLTQRFLFFGGGKKDVRAVQSGQSLAARLPIGFYIWSRKWNVSAQCLQVKKMERTRWRQSPDVSPALTTDGTINRAGGGAGKIQLFLYKHISDSWLLTTESVLN